jgi:hypothetical protein
LLRLTVFERVRPRSSCRAVMELVSGRVHSHECAISRASAVAALEQP